ncbi:MAG TPA: FAD-dependent oxidoreductase, partial [Pyrinomonadaceae bacterium]
GKAGVFEEIFSTLPVPAPDVRLIDSDYVVRLPDKSEIKLAKERSEFNEELRRVFPECAPDAIRFYDIVEDTAAKVSTHTVLDHVQETSARFQRFIDGQLRAFIQTPIERCALTSGCNALKIPRQSLYEFVAGPAAVAESLSEAITQAGGKVRLNSPVLRLAYDEAGKAIGVDLLSGERIVARHAVISNMTIWDTYGKLIGLNRTPSDMKKKLSRLNSGGAYLIYASVESLAMERLRAKRFLVCADSSDADVESADLTFAASSVPTIPGKTAVTVKVNCPVNDWFAFQSSLEDFEAWDQEALERVWARLHRAVPELGDAIEIIETANPRTFYDELRRKLGMVLGVEQTVEGSAHGPETTLPNVFMVGDTASSVGLEAVARSSARLAQHLLR